MSKPTPKTILVVKNRAMGDSIIGLSTIQYLRDIYPKATIIYAVPPWIKPLYNNIQCAADEIISLELSSIKNWYKQWLALKKYHIDIVFELFQSGRTHHFFNLWNFFGGPTYFAHNHHKKEGDIFDQGVIKPNIQRDLDGAWTYFKNQEETPPSYLKYPPKMKVITSTKNRQQITLGVVATRKTKMWPLDHYKKFIQLAEKNIPNYHIVIPLGPGDQWIADELSYLSLNNYSIIQEKLEQLPKILEPSDLYIGNDTGLKHICVSLDIPTYTLFGPEPPLEWHPYDESMHQYYFLTPLECRTRDAHFCGLSQCESMICLNQFRAEDLLEKVISLLAIK